MTMDISTAAWVGNHAIPACSTVAEMYTPTDFYNNFEKMYEPEDLPNLFRAMEAFMVLVQN